MARARRQIALEAEAALLTSRNRDAERKRRPGILVPSVPRAFRRSAMSDTERREYRRGQMHRRLPQRRSTGDHADAVLKTSGSTITLSGWACVTGRWYQMYDAAGPYMELIAPGAFRKTLSENPRCVLNINHDGLPLARLGDGLKLTEIETGETTGLWVEAKLDANRTDVRDLVSAIQTRALIGLSFAFVITRRDWDEDYENLTIREVSLADGDVSFVGHSANYWTDGSAAVGTTAKKPALPDYMFPIDPGKSGAGGESETQAAKKLAEARALTAMNRAAEARRLAHR